MRKIMVIGIDPGTKTGIAFWNTDTKELVMVETMSIHQAMDSVRNNIDRIALVRVEDARRRVFFGNAGREVLQGAGSIKRDCVIWEDFLTDLGIPFMMTHPKNARTKLKADTFKNLTRWQGRTTEHSRDAAMLVFNHNS